MSVSDYGDYHQRRQEGIWHFLNRLLVLLIVFAVITFIICLFRPALSLGREQADREEHLRKDVETQTAIHAARLREINLLSSDPAYVEVLARNRLDMMKANETIFRFDTQASSSPSKSRQNTQ